MVEVQENKTTSTPMGQEIVVMSEAAAHLKQIMLAVGGFIIRVLWQWKPPIQWPSVIAAFLFMIIGMYFNSRYTPKEYTDVGALFIGLFSSNIIKGLFRWWAVNEEGLMDKTKRWWDSDKKDN